MGKNTGLWIIGGLAVLYLAYKARADGPVNDQFSGGFGPGVTGDPTYELPMPNAPPGQDQTPAFMAYNQAVQAFNTAPSVRAGLDVINTGAAAGLQLPRTSQTIARNVVLDGRSGNIARLGDGSVAHVSVQRPSGGGIMARIAASGTRLRGGRPTVAGGI